MKMLVVSLAVLLSAGVSSSKAPEQVKALAPQPRVGQVIIDGNVFTTDSAILHHVHIYPKQILSYGELRETQKKLEQLGIFKPGSVRVTAVDDPNNPGSEYKNVIIKVEETATWSIKLMTGLNSQCEPVVSVVWEERNFDPSRLPVSFDDLIGGGAFRGSGYLFRLELLQVALWPSRTPRFLQIGGGMLSVGDSDYPSGD
jgi:outer membrane protein assembly factor BamA